MNMGIVNKAQTKHLSEAASQETVRVLRLKGGRGFASNLARLGVLPGATVRVLSRARSGPVVIECKGSRIAIGRGMAERVEVAPVCAAP